MKNLIVACALILSSPFAHAKPDSFYACGTPSIIHVDKGHPVPFVVLTYSVDSEGKTSTVALTGGTNRAVNRFLANIKIPSPDQQLFLCVTGTEPIEWAYGKITTVSKTEWNGLPSGVSVGN